MVSHFGMKPRVRRATYVYESPESMTAQGITMKMQHQVVEADLNIKQIRAEEPGDG